jgi:hypothetical protein
VLGQKGKSGHSTGKFRVSLYKALLFLHVQNGIKSGALNLEHSYKYRPLDDYLIDSDRWQRAKQQLGPTNCCSDSDVRPLRRPLRANRRRRHHGCWIWSIDTASPPSFKLGPL